MGEYHSSSSPVKSSPNLRGALAIARKGKAVFPCKPDNKAPYYKTPINGGFESLAALEEGCGPLPVTLKAVTRSGGWHPYFIGIRDTR